MLSQHLGEDELAAVVSRFEELAHDTVVALGGRVVKMIGDEAMFVVPTATGAAEIGLSLAEAYADDELLSDVRVALAIGPVLVQDGDFYGPVVNLASRLVGVANPGTVLISDEFRAALDERGRHRVRHPRPPAPQPEGHRPGPGVEAVPGRRRPGRRHVAATCGGSGSTEVLARARRVAGAGARRIVRRRAGRRPGISSVSRHDGGDPVGSEVELPLEGSDRSTP